MILNFPTLEAPRETLIESRHAYLSDGDQATLTASGEAAKYYQESLESALERARPEFLADILRDEALERVSRLFPPDKEVGPLLLAASAVGVTAAFITDEVARSNFPSTPEDMLFGAVMGALGYWTFFAGTSTRTLNKMANIRRTLIAPATIFSLDEQLMVEQEVLPSLRTVMVEEKRRRIFTSIGSAIGMGAVAHFLHTPRFIP